MPKVAKQRPRTKKSTTSSNGVLSRIGEGWEQDDGIKCLVYGESGSGKTTFWATFPKPILVILCSGPIKPGELRSISTREYVKVIHPVAIRSSEELSELVAHQMEPDKYKTVVLDHASGFQDLIIKEIGGFEDIQLDRFRVAGRGESWGIISQQQWGQVSSQTKQHLRDLLNLSCNVVIVAQERETRVEEEVSDLDLLPHVGAALTPGTAGWLNPACDYIFQTFKRRRSNTVKVKVAGKTVEKQKIEKGVEYCLRTAPHPIYTTKFRVPKGTLLPDEIVDPDYNKLLAIINQ